MSTKEELLEALHLWLHRESGDEDLAKACEGFKWTILSDPALPEVERKALTVLFDWDHGIGVDLIYAAEDFHETYDADACQKVDERVVELDGKVADGRADDYEQADVIPLVRLKGQA
jgi:hypothetical protein